MEARPRPEKKVASLLANDLRVKRLEIILVFSYQRRFSKPLVYYGKAKLKMSIPEAIATYCLPCTA
jgi:hypothetical protein